MEIPEPKKMDDQDLSEGREGTVAATSVTSQDSSESAAPSFTRDEPYSFEVREREGKYGTEIYLAEGVLEITGSIYATRESRDHGLAERRKIAAMFAAAPALYEAVRIAALRLTELSSPGSLIGGIRDDLYAAYKLANGQATASPEASKQPIK